MTRPFLSLQRVCLARLEMETAVLCRKCSQSQYYVVSANHATACKGPDKYVAADDQHYCCYTYHQTLFSLVSRSQTAGDYILTACNICNVLISRGNVFPIYITGYNTNFCIAGFQATPTIIIRLESRGQIMYTYPIKVHFYTAVC